MPPKNNNLNEYLKTKVMTASPEQLQLMLYDGAIRFCEQARQDIQDKRVEDSFHHLSKVQKIVLELMNGLRDDVAPELCQNMRRLYLFCYDRLVEANIKKTISAVDDALLVLRDIRHTWIMLMEKLNQEKAAQSPSPTKIPVDRIEPGQEVGIALSIEG